MSFKTSIAACAGLLLLTTSAFAQVGGGDIPAAASAKAGMNADGQKMGGQKMGGMTTGSMRTGRSASKKMMMRHGSGKMSGHKTF